MKRFLINTVLLLPGIAVLLIITWGGEALSRFLGEQVLGFSKSPISAVMIALVLGLIAGNIIKIPHLCDKGIQFGSKKLLRVGIVLLGLRLSILQVGEVALVSLPVVVICVLVGLFLPYVINRWMKLPPDLVILISVGTSICGVSAIVATSESLSVKKEYTAYAIATITFFGLLSMVIYPFVSHVVFSSQSFPIGLFLGTSIHDTAQVTGAAFIYRDYYLDERVVEIATIVKLLRNMLMIGVIPVLALVQRKARKSSELQQTPTKHPSLIPLFVLGFILMAVLRTIGDEMIGITMQNVSNVWNSFIALALQLSSTLITMALASVGLTTSVSLFSSLGLKPLGLGFLSACIVGITSSILIILFF